MTQPRYNGHTDTGAITDAVDRSDTPASTRAWLCGPPLPTSRQEPAVTFDRYDICEAYYMAECLYHVGGVLWERESCVRRGEARGYTAESVGVQLHRLGFRPAPSLTVETLTENGRAIFDALIARLGFDPYTDADDYTDDE